MTFNRSTIALMTAAVVSLGISAPAKANTVVETAVKAGSFNTLVAALQAAGLAETLNGSGPFTVFAPTDDAFAKLPAGTVESLLKPENRQKLVSILTYHVLSGRVMADDIAGKKTSAATVNGASVNIDASYGEVKVNGAKVVASDVMATNGVIHMIDTVILPPQ